MRFVCVAGRIRVRWPGGRGHVPIPAQQGRRSRGPTLRLAELLEMLIALPLFGNWEKWMAEIANLAFAEEPYQTRNEIRNFVPGRHLATLHT